MSFNDELSNEDQLLQIIYMIRDLGWEAAVKVNEDSAKGKISGLVIGTEDYIAEVLKDDVYELFLLEGEEAHIGQVKGVLH